MRRLPSFGANGRGKGIALVAALALGQAAAAGLAAFSTRDVFVAFRDSDGDLPLLALGLVATAGLTIAALRIVERVVAERVGQDYAAAIRVKLFTHLSQMSARDVAARRTGALAMRFVGDLSAIRGWVSQGVARLISASIVLPVACGILFALNPDLGLAAVAPIALGLGLMAFAGPRLGPAHRRLRARRARLAADMSERIPHAPELRLLGRIGRERTRLLRRTNHMIAAALSRARGAAFLRAVPDGVAGIAAAAVLLVALAGGGTAAEAAGALAALGLMIQPMRDLAGVWDRHRAWIAARDKCLALLAAPRLTRKKIADGRKSANSWKAGDRPNDLCFAKVSAGQLTALTATVPAGAKIAIVGGNGAGKSTLLALAAGIEQPDKGRVSLASTSGKRAPSDLSADERRKAIALVGARSPILAGSLRRALTMGCRALPDDKAVCTTAEVYGLAPVLARLGGLDGRISEAGRNLSAGECRRVHLVRAALSGSQLLLLDEPDDALDADGPALVDRLVRGTEATVLLVTHDLAIARRMDQLWYLEDGRLLESGPPETVLAGDGPAARFFAPRPAA